MLRKSVFETVLNVKAYKDIQEAVYTVFRSRESGRVKAYSTVQGMEQSHQIAVVIQLMVQSEISGVLFTADPITDSYFIDDVDFSCVSGLVIKNKGHLI